jgi:Ca2+-binding RTX toxin-like protein
VRYRIIGLVGMTAALCGLAVPAFAQDINGTGGADSLVGTPKADTIKGFAGNDSELGKKGDDVLFGGSGADVLSGGYGHDVMTGGPGRDSLSDVFKPNESPVRQWDRYLGGSGRDRILIGGGVDVVFGGPGNDRILTFDDGDVDKVNCGRGYDTVKAQNVQNDDLKSCEKVVIYSAD